MARSVRIMTIEDVTTDDDLLNYYRYTRRLAHSLAREFAATAADLSAMLKAHDKRSGRRRRGKVVRPMALAAGVMMLIARYIALSAKRFQVEYQPEIEANKRRRPSPSGRTIRFGP